MKTSQNSWTLRSAAACLAMLVLAPAASMTQSEKAPEQVGEGAALFNRHCAKCHGRDGRAKRFRGMMLGARNLTDPKWQEEATDERIAAAIRKGPGPMPSFAEKLSEAEIDTLVAYVRQFRKERTPTKN